MTYRLLRDNKESGPFSEEEMIAKGFKPYDLIWVEGKSAGWRYPSEIAAFKNFAPVVEEQPYDRFYKKQPPQKHFAMEEKNTAASYVPAPAKTIEPAQPAPAPSKPAYKIQQTPGRHIHVTLPSGNTVNLTTLVAKKENKEQKDTADINKTSVRSENREPVFTAPIPTVASQINTTYQDVAEENKVADKIPVYFNQPSAQPAAGFSWSLIAAAFIGVATLVGLGIMIGLAMNSKKVELVYTDPVHRTNKASVIPLGNENTKPAAGTIGLPDAPAMEANESLHPVSAAGKDLVQNAVVKNTVLPDENELKEIKKSGEEKPAIQKNKSSAAAEPQPTHAKPVAAPVNIEKSLTFSANKFKTGAWGGISGLQCTLVNGSKYALESVEVEIDYIQANNKIYKTEKLLFKDISAGAQSTIDAPASSRGIKITSRIIKVNAREAALSNTTAKS